MIPEDERAIKACDTKGIPREIARLNWKTLKKTQTTRNLGTSEDSDHQKLGTREAENAALHLRRKVCNNEDGVSVLRTIKMTPVTQRALLGV